MLVLLLFGWTQTRIRQPLVELGTFAVPSLTAYRELFAICAGAALLAAVAVLFAPRSAEAGAGSAPD